MDPQILELGRARAELGSITPESGDVLDDDDRELVTAGCGEHRLITRPIGGAPGNRSILEPGNDLMMVGSGDSLALAYLVLDARVALFLGAEPGVDGGFHRSGPVMRDTAGAVQPTQWLGTTIIGVRAFTVQRMSPRVSGCPASAADPSSRDIDQALPQA